MSEKSNSFNLIKNMDPSDVCQLYDVDYHSRNTDKTSNAENLIPLNSANSECLLLDSVKNSTISPSSYDVHSNSSSEKRLNLPIMAKSFCGSARDEIKTNFEKNIDKSINLNLTESKNCKKLIKIDNEIIEPHIMIKESLLDISNELCSKSNEIKDHTEDINFDIRKCNDSNVKSSKSFLKKDKKGVDSLLKKLETCNKRLLNTLNTASATITHLEEKDSSSIKSMSPEYLKSRSPNNREDDVISPTFSNDDSNDTKQRRKRKLGKPVRLSKDLKLENDITEIESSKSDKLDNCNNSNRGVKSETVGMASYLHEVVTAEHKSDCIDKNQILRCSIQSCKKDKTEINNSGIKKLDSYINEIYSVQPYNNHLNNLNKSVDTCNLKKKQSFFHIKKNAYISRTRRISECSLNSPIKRFKLRRKSCSDIKDLCNEVPEVYSSKNNTVFNKVESELEKMFAGLIECERDLSKKETHETDKSIHLLSDDDQKTNLVNLAKNKPDDFPVDIRINHASKSSKRKHLNNNRSFKRKQSNAFKETVSDSTTNLRKYKKGQVEFKRKLQKSSTQRKKKNGFKFEHVSENFSGNDLFSCNSTSKYRGPVVQIKKSDLSLICSQIINISREDDEDKNKEKRKNNVYNTNGRSKRLNFQSNLDYRGKVSNTGLYNSTLSIRYDAYTADASWICVFCKKGPHYLISSDSTKFCANSVSFGTYMPSTAVLSDLFGPYLIDKDSAEDDASTFDNSEIVNEQKRDNKRNSRNAGTTDQLLSNNKKKRKSVNDVGDIYLGITKLNSDEQQWEIWLHEQCVMWSAGVYITGGKINGLQDAVWDAVKSSCDSCGLPGANIGCVKRGCRSATHYCCALTSGWHLDVDQYIPKCNIHKVV